MTDRNNAARAKAWRAEHPGRQHELWARWNPPGIHPKGPPSLTPLEVREIRRDLDRENLTRKEAAVKYRVSYNTIRRIDEGVTYNGAEYYE